MLSPDLFFRLRLNLLRLEGVSGTCWSLCKAPDSNDLCSFSSVIEDNFLWWKPGSFNIRVCLKWDLQIYTEIEDSMVYSKDSPVWCCISFLMFSPTVFFLKLKLSCSLEGASRTVSLTKWEVSPSLSLSVHRWKAERNWQKMQLKEVSVESIQR